MALFRDIPQYITEGSYEVNIDIDDIDRTIERYVSGYNLDIDPDFQRGHVWDEEKQIRFIEFMLRGGRSSRVIYFNHPGWMNSFKGDFVLVDGKQRLNAAMRFVKNEIPAFGYYRKEYTDKPSFIHSSFQFNINSLKTRKEVLQWYLDLNTGGVVHTKEEIDKVKKLLAKEK